MGYSWWDKWLVLEVKSTRMSGMACQKKKKKKISSMKTKIAHLAVFHLSARYTVRSSYSPNFSMMPLRQFLAEHDFLCQQNVNVLFDCRLKLPCTS